MSQMSQIRSLYGALFRLSANIYVSKLRFAVIWLGQIHNLDTGHVYVLGLKSGSERLWLFPARFSAHALRLLGFSLAHSFSLCLFCLLSLFLTLVLAFFRPSSGVALSILLFSFFFLLFLLWLWLSISPSFFHSPSLSLFASSLLSRSLSLFLFLDDDCFYYHSWRNNVVIAFGTLLSFLT